MGGHVAACTDCGHWRVAYNSCRNRHRAPSVRPPRPRAPGSRTGREAELLPVGVLPRRLHPPGRALADDRAAEPGGVVYGLLFQRRRRRRLTTDRRRSQAPRAREIGFLAVLHTWGSAESPASPAHVTLRRARRRHRAATAHAGSPHDRRFFLPVRVLGKPLPGQVPGPAQGAARSTAASSSLLRPASRDLADRGRVPAGTSPPASRPRTGSSTPSPPSAGPRQVLKYLARYTHRVAIS